MAVTGADLLARARAQPGTRTPVSGADLLARARQQREQAGSLLDKAEARTAQEEDETTMLERAGAFTVRVAAPMVGGIAGGMVGGPLGAAAGATLAATGAEFLASRIEDEPVTPGRIIASAALAPIPGARVAKGAALGTRLAIRSAQGALEGAAQAGIEDIIDEGELTSNVLVGGLAGATIGGAVGGVESAFANKAARRIQSALTEDAPDVVPKVVDSPKDTETLSDLNRIAKETTATDIPSPDTTDRIRQAYSELSRGRPNVRIRLADLRERLPDLSKDEIDDALGKLERNRQAAILPLDDPREIKARDTKASFPTSIGTGRHIIYMDPTPAKTPKPTPPKAPKPQAQITPDPLDDLRRVASELETETAIKTGAAAAPGKGPFQKTPRKSTDPVPPELPKEDARLLSADDVDRIWPGQFTQEEGDLLTGILQEHQGDLAKAADGRQTLARTQELAKGITINADEIPAGPIAATAEELAAAKNFVEGMTGKLARLRTQLEANPESPALQQTIERTHLDLVRGTLLIQKVISAAGRTLQATKKFGGGILDTPMSRFSMAAGKVEGASADDIVAALRRAGDDPVKMMREMLLLQARNASPGEKAQALWLTNLLAGPRTMERNGFGNMVRQVTELVNKLGAAGIDATVSRITGRQRQVFANEAVVMVAAARKAIPEATATFFQVLKQGFSDQQARDFFEGVAPLPRSKFLGLPRRSFETEWLNKVSNLLEATDQFSRTIGKAMARNAKAYSLAERAAAKLDNISPEMKREFHEELAAQFANPLTAPASVIEEIERLGKRGVFREDGAVSAWIQGLFNNKTIPAPFKVLARLFIPFIKTPTNIVKQGLQSSPIGFISALSETNPRIRRQKQAEALMGTTVMGSVMYWATQGFISGNPPSDNSRGQRDAFFARHPANSIYLGQNVGWVRYSDLGPLALPLSFAADFVRGVEEAGIEAEMTDEDVEYFMAGLASMADGSTKALTQFPMVSAMAEVAEMVRGHGSFSDRAFGVLRSPLSGIIPAPIKFARELTDPTIRQPKTFQEVIANLLPVQSETVRPRLDIFGQPIVNPPSRPVSFAAVAQPKEGDIDIVEEFQRADVPLKSRRIIKNLTFRGKKIPLSKGEDVAFRQAAGQMLRERATALILRPLYQRSSKEGKKHQLRNLKSAVTRIITGRARARKNRGLTFSIEDLLG